MSGITVHLGIKNLIAFICIVLLFSQHVLCQRGKARELKIAFWNLENFMDTIDDTGQDDDFTPSGVMEWDSHRFDCKLKKTGQVIKAMNADILGVCEIEHGYLMGMLATGDSLKHLSYQYVHFESNDIRGIDVGLFYKSDKLKILYAAPIPASVESDKTRDILFVKLLVTGTGDTINVFVNHWPSRRTGVEKSKSKRISAAQSLRQFIDSLNLASSKLIIMGDFNDNPIDSSISFILGAGTVFDPASDLVNLPGNYSIPFTGTAKYGQNWYWFDQIIISKTLFKSNNYGSLQYKSGNFDRFAPVWMIQGNGRETAPFRTYKGKVWQNGYSDHFPVFATLMYEQKK